MTLLLGGTFTLRSVNFNTRSVNFPTEGKFTKSANKTPVREIYTTALINHASTVGKSRLLRSQEHMMTSSSLRRTLTLILLCHNDNGVIMRPCCTQPCDPQWDAVMSTSHQPWLVCTLLLKNYLSILASDSQVLMLPGWSSYLDIISLVEYTRFSEQSCFECSILVQKICYWVCILRKEIKG